MNRIASTIAFALAVAVTPAAADSKPYKQRLDAPANGTVEIVNVAGSVRIEGWRRNAVEVEGDIGDGVERIDFRNNGERTVVRVELIKRDTRGLDAAADLVIRVPRGSSIVANTVSAPIGVHGVDGSLNSRSVSGSVELDGAYSIAEAESISGEVRILSSGKDARIQASSISGRVDVQKMQGSLTARSVSGSITVKADGVTRGDMSSISGTVTYDAPFNRGGHYEFETMSGTIRLVVRGEPDAAFEFQTFSGSIDNDFGPQPERTSRYAPGLTLKFTEGNGSATVKARAVAGSLKVSRD